MGWVYGIQSGHFIKVGVANDIQRRLSDFRLCNPHPIKVVLRRMVPENYWIEKRMHALLVHYAIGREWFDCSPEMVRQAYETAYKDLVSHRHTQSDWEHKSAQRAEQRIGEGKGKLGRPAKIFS